MAFVGRRLLQLVPVAFGVTFIVFFMVHLIPGDPAVSILGIHATPRAVAILHREWGLNRSLPAQYWLFLDRLVHGNLGYSLYYGQSTTSLVLSHLPPTLWLIVYAGVLSVLISVPLAMIGASRPDALRDHVVRAVPLVGLGMPSFWLAFLLILIFAIKVQAFPVSGYGSGFFGHLRSMFLPSLTAALALSRPPDPSVPALPPTSLGPTSLAEQAVLNSLAGTLDLGINYPLPTANAMPSQETSPNRPPVP